MLEEYIKQLMHHDWFYSYSDDHSVWKAGKEENARLSAIAASGKPFRMAYDAVSEYMRPSMRDFAKLDNKLKEAKALEKHND